MHKQGIDYRSEINALGLIAKTKKGVGFSKEKKSSKDNGKIA